VITVSGRTRGPRLTQAESKAVQARQVALFSADPIAHSPVGDCLAAVRLTSRAGGSRQTSGSLAGLCLCMVIHVGNSGGSRDWQGLLGRRPDWESAHPGQRVSARDRCPGSRRTRVRQGCWGWKHAQMRNPKPPQFGHAWSSVWDRIRCFVGSTGVRRLSRTGFDGEHQTRKEYEVCLHQGSTPRSCGSALFG
jgi:hypothetical protein